MLREDQAAALLLRCERLIGRRLEKTRGNLKKAQSRAAALWELICIDAFSQIGDLVHEPPGRSSPDIVLSSVGDSQVWIEVGYLYPRSWKNDRRAEDLRQQIYREASRLKIPEVRISTHFRVGKETPAGPVRSLPNQHELSRLLRAGSLRSFFDVICAAPDRAHVGSLDPYSLSLAYDPEAKGPFVHSSGVIEEQPTAVEEHALYRTLEEKARQHKPDCPYVVCVGAHQGYALSRQGTSYRITERHAVVEVFRRRPKVSAIIAVGIESSMSFGQEFRLIACSRLYCNDNAIRPLLPGQFKALLKLDFNRWRYDFALRPWEDSVNNGFRQSGGTMTVGSGRTNGTISLTVPSTVLVECLAGRTSLLKEYPDKPSESLLRCVNEGWRVVGCKYVDGSIEQALASRLTLELAPPHERVFGSG